MGVMGHGAALLPDGRVLVVGGSSNSQSFGDTGFGASTEIFDPSTGLWSAADNMLSSHVLANVIALPNGQVLVAGGSGLDGYLGSAEIFDSRTALWSQAGLHEFG